MFERFVRDAHYAALEATSVAAGLGSDSVEAEHLLISLAAGNSSAGHALREAGLDAPELRDAIQRDFERVLRTAGIDASGVDLGANCRRSKPRWGASAKQGLQRALADGWTWAQIAEALGVTRQAVHKKHARRLKDVRTLRP